MRGRKRRTIVGAAAALMVAGTAVGYPWLKGRMTPPHQSAASAAAAVDAARRAEAATWAADQLRAAELTLRASLAEQRRQEVRLPLLRDYAGARAGFALAQSEAYAAALAARERRAEADDVAATWVRRASQAVGAAERLSRTIRLDRDGRRQLSRSRELLAEAVFLQQRGEPRRAGELAEQAVHSAERAVQRATHLAARYVDEEQIAMWRRLIDETISASRRSGGPVIIVNKEEHLLTLYVAGRAVRSYRADIGRNNLADKLWAGDRATPEGRYTIIAKKGPDASRYHRALELDYPNAADLRRFESARRASELAGNARPGGLIEIHGDGGRGVDWTDGCVALSSRDIDDLYARVAVGTPVTIVGGDGNGGVFSEALRSNAEMIRAQ